MAEKVTTDKRGAQPEAGPSGRVLSGHDQAELGREERGYRMRPCLKKGEGREKENKKKKDSAVADSHRGNSAAVADTHSGNPGPVKINRPLRVQATT